jgi:hypothetical protein
VSTPMMSGAEGRVVAMNPQAEKIS